MKTIKIKGLLNKILDSKGRVFGITYKTKSGNTIEINGRLVKNPKPEHSTHIHTVKAIYDNNKKRVRVVDLNRVTAIKINKEVFRVNN